MLKKSRKIRKNRIRAKISGTKLRPRLSVFRSNKLLYVQLIDDKNGVTLASASGKDAKEIAKSLVAKAKLKKITRVVFDRSGYKYHGKIKLIAEEVRAQGIKI